MGAVGVGVVTAADAGHPPALVPALAPAPALVGATGAAPGPRALLVISLAAAPAAALVLAAEASHRPRVPAEAAAPHLLRMMLPLQKAVVLLTSKFLLFISCYVCAEDACICRNLVVVV